MHQHIQKNLFLFCRHWPSVMRWIALMTISHSERDGQWCSRGDGDWDKGTGLSDFFFFMLPSLALQGLCLQWVISVMDDKHVCFPLLVCVFRLDRWDDSLKFLLPFCSFTPESISNYIWPFWLSLSPLHASQTGARARRRWSWRRRCF